MKKMTLDEWLKEKKFPSVYLCKLLGCNESTMSNWRSGKRIPDRRYKMMIEKITEGKVVYE